VFLFTSTCPESFLFRQLKSFIKLKYLFIYFLKYILISVKIAFCNSLTGLLKMAWSTLVSPFSFSLRLVHLLLSTVLGFRKAMSTNSSAARPFQFSMQLRSISCSTLCFCLTFTKFEG